uniref:UPAR/Ly6 domain-containing protein n=1 Tax=Trichobilharzia regenti TaxID=157069 RepID=A0AA85JMF8_TRIRE|nr:unnamed protein product [Trichobilharzia regenti]
MNLMLLIIFIMSTSLWIQTGAIRCYTCDQCSLPVRLADFEIADDCKYCKTIEYWRYFSGGITTRQCVKHCKTVSNWFYWSLKSVQFTVKCCTVDLCNTGNSITVNSYLFIIFPLQYIIWKY